MFLISLLYNLYLRDTDLPHIQGKWTLSTMAEGNRTVSRIFSGEASDRFKLLFNIPMGHDSFLLPTGIRFKDRKEAQSVKGKV